MQNDQQRTEEWFKAREGKLTASMFAAAAGLGPGSRQQAWRRVIGIEKFEGNAATEWGTENEPIALACYENRCAVGVSTELTGFVIHPEHDWLGCSPDLLIGTDGLGEIKCPASQKLYPVVPPYYLAQVQGQLEVTRREWCDFIVWTPDAMSVTRIQRSPAYWMWMHERLAEFWMYVVAEVEPPRMKREDAPLIPECIGGTTIFNLKEN